MPREGIFGFVLLAVCIAVCLAQQNEPAESAEAGQGDAGGAGGGVDVEGNPTEGADQPPTLPGSSQPSGSAEDNEAVQPEGPIIPLPPSAGGFNPHGLTGQRLRIFNARLNFVRRELCVISQAIARFLFFGREEAALLNQELLLALEEALFPPLEDPLGGLPPLGGGFPV